jgi:hypothetical protein
MKLCITLIFYYYYWGETESTWYVGHYLAYCASPVWRVWSSRWNENWNGNRSTRRKPAQVPLRPQIPHDSGLGSNLGRLRSKPTTSRLSYEAAECISSKHMAFVINYMYCSHTAWNTDRQQMLTNVQSQIWSMCCVWMCSKPSLIRLQLIRIEDGKCCSQLSTCFKRHVTFRMADVSLVCPDKSWHSFFKPALLRSKTSTTSESSIDE